MDLAKYHELSRFVEESETYDHEAAIFHVDQAAKCGILEAIKTMANLHLGLQHDILPDIEASFICTIRVDWCVSWGVYAYVLPKVI